MTNIDELKRFRDECPGPLLPASGTVRFGMSARKLPQVRQAQLSLRRRRQPGARSELCAQPFDPREYPLDPHSARGSMTRPGALSRSMSAFSTSRRAIWRPARRLPMRCVPKGGKHSGTAPKKGALRTGGRGGSLEGHRAPDRHPGRRAGFRGLGARGSQDRDLDRGLAGCREAERRPVGRGGCGVAVRLWRRRPQCRAAAQDLHHGTWPPDPGAGVVSLLFLRARLQPA